MQRSSLFAFVIIISAMTLAGGAPFPASAAQPLTIGAINPLTGTNAVQGRDMKRGEGLALDEINAAGGINGRLLKIIWEDTASSADKGMQAVRKLVEKDKVPLIIGGYSSGVSLPTGRWTNSKKVIQISVASTAPELRNIGPYFFNVIGLDEAMGIKLAEFALESGAQTYASIVVDNPFGQGIETWTAKTIEKAGGQWIQALRYKENQGDYKPVIKSLYAQNPEVVFFTAYGTDAELILAQAHEMGLKPSKGWYAAYMTMWYHDVIAKTAEGIQGMVVGRHGGPRFKHYQEAYWKKFGAVYQKLYQRPVMQTAFGAYAYDATWMAALALKKADGSNPDDVAKALHQVGMAYDGATGDKSFDRDGMQVIEYYQRMVYQEGKLVPNK
jgi:branched-chain amino acid transport system substrate-binding protein